MAIQLVKKTITWFKTILVLHFFPAVCVLRKDLIIGGENPISHRISSDYSITAFCDAC